jgi:DivIVA domain-containing protein
MALTPEDVVNKRFNPTKFREGYDQDEVDDFLDEVVVELRRLNQENEELRQRLVAGEARISELQRGGAAPQPAAEPAPVAEAPAPEPEPEPEPAPVAEAPVVTPVQVQSEDHVSDTTSTNNLLQLARRLHEEHVREGVERRDALVAEGHAAAAKLVADAEASSQATLGRLEQRKGELEGTISELQTFEREYRTKLKDYISGQLKDLESSPAIAGEAPVAAARPAAQAGVPPFPQGDLATASADRAGGAGQD